MNYKNFSVNTTERVAGKLGLVLWVALIGCAAYGQPSASIGVAVPLPSVAIGLPNVEIRADSDFYAPLAPDGDWVAIGTYGQCWRPRGVASDWRPYCNGSWQETDAGWYWVSDEPWAWATYHYGRWDFADQYGWYWVPQTQWAPAWVSWHQGGGYVGWAPLQPFVSLSANGFVGFNQSRISPRAFVFVKQGQFLDPIRPSIVVVNTTTIIRQTKTITNTKIVNKRVVNGGPAATAIAKASGRKVQTLQVQDLRHKEEAPVVTRQQTAKGTPEIKNQSPASRVVAPEKKTIVAHEPALAQKPDVVAPQARIENNKPLATVPEQRPEPKPEPIRPAAIKEPVEPRQLIKPEKTAQPELKKVQQPPAERPAANENNGANQADKEHENKP